ncbi:MAG: 50S ribosomal protein L5 [Mycoplasmatales bacterium]
MSYIKTLYNDEVKNKLMTDFGYKSIMQVPKIDKVVINLGIGSLAGNSKLVDETVEEIKLITGQKPVVTLAKNSIAGFKLREGMPVGIKVTLRNENMYAFLDKLIRISLPRIRDFRGLSANSFDGRGSYTFGLKEQLIFPEIDYDKVSKVKGMDVTIVTTANTDDEGRALLAGLGMPFVKKGA